MDSRIPRPELYDEHTANMLVFMLVLAGVFAALHLPHAPLAHPARCTKFRMMVRKAVGCGLHHNPRQHART